MIVELPAGSFHQVTGLLRLAHLVGGNLGTIYKVTWAFEGDEMTGATRAYGWQRWWELLLLQHLQRATQRGTSTQVTETQRKLMGKWLFLQYYDLKFKPRDANLSLWPAENMPKHLTRLCASVVRAGVVLWRSDALCMPWDRRAEGLGTPLWGHLHISGLPVFDGRVEAQRNVINPLKDP